MKKFLTIILALVMILCLAACGSSQPAGTKDAAEAPKGGTGNLVLYSSMTEADLDAMLGAFAEVYPDINVEVVNGSAGELVTRITGEAANPVGDLVWGGMADSDGTKNAEIFEAWISEHDAENPENFRSKNGLYSMEHLSTVVFCVNTELEKELGLDIKSYEDLLDPKLKGKITTADPNSSSSAWNNLSNIFAVYGNDTEETWDYIEQLMPNLVQLGSSSQVFKQVQQGEYVVGLTYEDGAVGLLRDGATNIRLQYPTNGTSASVFGSALIKNGPNPENAKLMIDFLCSAEGQNAIAAKQGGTLRYTNSGFKMPENAWLTPSEEITWAFRDVEYLTANKTAILERWNELWAKIGGTVVQ